VFPTVSNYSISRGVDYWFQLVDNPENELIHIKKIADFDKCKRENKVGAILHFEGSGGLESEFHTLRNCHKLGLRSMGLSWSNLNQFATGVGTDEMRGLTAEGKQLIEEMEELGIIVDVSHLNEKSFWDVVNSSSKPLIASHSNAYSLCDHIRNLKDDQIEAIGGTNGTVGINFCVGFLSSELNKDEITLETIKNHIDYIVDKAGINHVSLGSDYDGATVPTVVKDVSYYPKLLDYLEENGYNKTDLNKIKHENFMRVMKACWK
ncbi:MAG: membrane dipeptidase, partial [Candidatus Heimdallarchaeota archaeon]|nr:membrane dipeptidase [Candidatus Heimdallarchaeota archaeon]MCK4877802.1 membrane dipeptidase [Candidatus Heimdallarchaeota archaeon]